MRSILIIVSAALILIAGMPRADEAVSAGKATFERVCEACHYEDDFAGKSRQDILGLIEEVAAGEVEHKADLSELSKEEMADLADFFASFE